MYKRQPVRWVSNGGTEYEMTEGDKQTVGSEITLYLNDDCLEFANEYRVREVIQKYCSFMPVAVSYTHLKNDRRNSQTIFSTNS